jgi:hypothetical protein
VEASGPLWEQLHLPSELALREVDLYHSPLFTCPVVREAPSVITIHDAIPETRPDLCPEEYLEFYRRSVGRSVRAAEAVVTVSEFSRREITRHLEVPPGKVHVIYQSVSGAFSPGRKREAAALGAYRGRTIASAAGGNTCDKTTPLYDR